MLSSSLFTPSVEAASWRFADLWLSHDQQGKYYFQQQDYIEAAKRFEDPMWKGISLYIAGDFQQAQSYFVRIDSAQGLFTVASALVRQREYIKARNTLRRLVNSHPDHQDAKANLALLESIIAQIDPFSESQGG